MSGGVTYSVVTADPYAGRIGILTSADPGSRHDVFMTYPSENGEVARSNRRFQRVLRDSSSMPTDHPTCAFAWSG
jgi:hypothetical protein